MEDANNALHAGKETKSQSAIKSPLIFRFLSDVFELRPLFAALTGLTAFTLRLHCLEPWSFVCFSFAITCSFFTRLRQHTAFSATFQKLNARLRVEKTRKSCLTQF